ncbi:kynureninase [Rhizobacter sp. AJA081-3]|uniref:kynureninase n=1 Tax=Rhizobacter sp. AJA081-3 TaxID=2753607 RepID=UPI001AE01FC6|nr:kynureninase [Rhizobacter sp. AJA081-3]QTN24752.1 kynureninase [Rhizobacter sp. AJA081-3]
MTTRQDALALDARDPLAALRTQFSLPEGVIYLDGNSLGVLPAATPERVAAAVRDEWGTGLIRSWNSAGWVDLPQRIGDKIGRLIGAGPGQTLAADSTSVNLFKVLSAALAIVQAGGDPQRRVIVSERSNFPTDLYIAESLARQHGFTLRLVEPDEIAAQFEGTLAVLMLTHVNYRTGRMHDMAALTRAAHGCGALALWDLAHSAGAVPVDLIGADVDFAVGCGYKYLNGGPGAPGFLWVHPRQLERMERDGLWQPLSGWFGHAAPFEFSPHYRPAAGIVRFSCGTPPVLGLTALEVGVDTLLAAEPLGGLAAMRRKSLALTCHFITLVEKHCAGHGLSVITPRTEGERGSQVNLAREEGAYAIVQALIARGVIGDFRAPDNLRFGFTPLYTRFVDVWDAVEHLRQVLESGEWQEARFHQKAAVT